MAPINVAEFEALALERLSPMVRDYFAGGAGDELTLAANRAAWRALRIHGRVMQNVAERDTRAIVIGHRVPTPIMVAPAAFQRLAHADAELATVRAAGRAGAIFVLSTLSTVDVEAICAAATSPVWFQLYMYKDRGLTAELIQRAESAGCRALVLTVDAPILGTRERDIRNHFHLPDGIEARNLTAAGHGAIPKRHGESGLAHYVAELLDAELEWDDIDWLRGITRLPVLVKGVTRPDDAIMAADSGAVGIIVSNHGGRQLDGAPPTAEVLPRVVDALGGRASVLVDGGIRRGADVLKALACGAEGVLLGRPVLWGLAVNGEEGAFEVLDLMRRELSEAMALAGCRDLSQITRDLVDPGQIALPSPWTDR